MIDEEFVILQEDVSCRILLLHITHELAQLCPTLSHASENDVLSTDLQLIFLYLDMSSVT